MKVLASYSVKFRRSGNPLTEGAVSACSTELGLTFPKPYVDFLLKHNGGSPSPAHIPYPGSATKIQRFFSIADGDLMDTCKAQRTDHGLPSHFLPIAELDESESFLLVDCLPENHGSLLFWSEVDEGFRHRDPEYSNAVDLYFSIDRLFSKFGPVKNREDNDGMFCRLYYSSSDPRNGPKLATAFADAGYDINFVLPTFRHPIFGSIDSEVFGMANTLLELGTASTHVDPLHDNASIAERLSDALRHWTGMLEATTENKYPPGQKMAKRNIANLNTAILSLGRHAAKRG